jgi:hypothetical protein
MERNNVFASSNTWIVSSDPIEGMSACTLLFYLCCPLYVAALRQGWSPAQGALPTAYKIHSCSLILMGNKPDGRRNKKIVLKTAEPSKEFYSGRMATLPMGIAAEHLQELKHCRPG